MKKIGLFFCILVLLSILSVSVYAESEPIKIIIGSVYDYADIYETEDAVEIKDILYHLNALWRMPENPEKENLMIIDDQKDWYISVFYADGDREVYRLDENWFYVQKGKSISYSGSNHRLNPGEFERFCTVITRLKNGEAPNTVFDKKYSDWAKEDIERAHTLKYTLPWNEANYMLPINRLEVCQIAESFLKARGIEVDVQNPAPFADTNDLAVAKLYTLGIINGKSETVFAPYDFITREELAKILAKLVALEQETYTPAQLCPAMAEGLQPFADENEILDWAKDSVYAMQERSILKGDNFLNFSPADFTTKEEVIACFNRVSFWWDIQKLKPCGEELTLEDFEGIRRGMDWNFVRYFIGDGISIGSGMPVVMYTTADGYELRMNVYWGIPEMRFWKPIVSEETQKREMQNELAVSYNIDGSIRFPLDKELTVAKLFENVMHFSLPETGIEEYTYIYNIEEEYEDGELKFGMPYLETDIILNEDAYKEIVAVLNEIAHEYEVDEEDEESQYYRYEEWELNKATENALYYEFRYVYQYDYPNGKVRVPTFWYVYIDSIGNGKYRMRTIG